MMVIRRAFIFEKIVIFASVFFLMLFLTIPASADMFLNYTNATGVKLNYSITGNISKLPSFINLVGGDIEMPSVTLKVHIDNVTLNNSNKSLILSSGDFGTYTTSDIPKQKVYVANSGTAIVNYSVNAHSAFANYVVNITTYKQISNNVPFFSDISVALLDLNDLKNKWSSDSTVLNELVNTIDNSNIVNETNVTLDGSGDYNDGSQNLPAGSYLILVTNGTDPKQIITSTMVRVAPFNSTITVPTTGTIGSDVSVSVSLSGAPPENYTYISSIIKWTDYNSNIGNTNISWTSGKTLVQSVRINGTLLDNASSLTDIIPGSNTTRNTTNSTNKTLTLSTTSLPAGDYLVHTVVFNSTNQTVAFNQSTITLSPAPTPTTTTPGSGGSGGSGGGGGGGGGSAENYSNILVKEKYELHIFKDKTTSYRFTSASNPIIYVNITGNTNAGAITTTVEVLRGTSSLVKTQAPGTAYVNVNIWVGTSGFAVSRNIKAALIGFKVHNSWIKTKGVSSSDVKLVKWDGSQWVQLETTAKGMSDEFTLYEATTKAFSPFAIVAKMSGTIPAETTQITQPTTAPTAAPSGLEKPTPYSAGIYILIAIGIILAVIIAIRLDLLNKIKEWQTKNE